MVPSDFNLVILVYDPIISRMITRRIKLQLKRGSAPKLARGFHHACADLKPAQRFAVYNGTERFPLNPETDAIGLVELAAQLQAY